MDCVQTVIKINGGTPSQVSRRTKPNDNQKAAMCDDENKLWIKKKRRQRRQQYILYKGGTQQDGRAGEGTE